ncbi:hypothetical protein FB567DRAFT_596970 [Paraphoma chrysanthemicola]|uniref:Uncharacterized protein n=1 Tax=Paraphoma chrysanthemicola TaxID=798071 RepID=A0A8K0QW21_9PLEO|nr:hypothetical protein FB567DRAFT_596970 [Paraphoma chrysanthemicola]
MPPVNQEVPDGQRINEPKDLETRNNPIESVIAITFDLCPEECKRGREACKNPEELERYLAQFLRWAGRSTQHDNGDNLHDDDLDFVNPYEVEYEVNPVIFSHLQEYNMQPQPDNFLPVHGTSDTLGEVTKLWKGQSGDMRGNDVSPVDKENQSISTEQQRQLSIAEAPPPAPASNGPAAMSVTLSSYPCPDCGEVFNEAFKRR